MVFAIYFYDNVVLCFRYLEVGYHILLVFYVNFHIIIVIFMNINSVLIQKVRNKLYRFLLYDFKLVFMVQEKETDNCIVNHVFDYNPIDSVSVNRFRWLLINLNLIYLKIKVLITKINSNYPISKDDKLDLNSPQVVYNGHIIIEITVLNHLFVDIFIGRN